MHPKFENSESVERFLEISAFEILRQFSIVSGCRDSILLLELKIGISELQEIE